MWTPDLEKEQKKKKKQEASKDDIGADFLAFDFDDDDDEGDKTSSSKPEFFDMKDITSVDPVSALLDLDTPIWVRDPGRYSANLAKMFNEEVEDYVKYISPTEAEHEMRVLTVERLRMVVKKIFPNASVSVFGSFETKLYLPTSDVDVVVMDESLRMPSCLFNLAHTLKDHSMVSKIEVIDKAKVPIIKYTDALTNFPVDISFNMGTGPEAARIVESFLDDPKLGHGIKGLMYVLKQFLLQRHLNEPFSGGLGSYGLLILVSSFLMMHPLIQCGQLIPQDNLGVLVLEFLQLYGKLFNFQELGIGVDLEQGTWYFRKETATWLTRRIGLLTILDPQDKTNDVGGGSFNFHQVRGEFMRAYLRVSCMIGSVYERSHKYSSGSSSASKQHIRFNRDGNYRVGDRNSSSNSSNRRRQHLQPNTILGAILSVRKGLYETRQHSEVLARRLRSGEVESGLSPELWATIEADGAARLAKPVAGVKRKRGQGEESEGKAGKNGGGVSGGGGGNKAKNVLKGPMVVDANRDTGVESWLASKHGEVHHITSSSGKIVGTDDQLRTALGKAKVAQWNNEEDDDSIQDMDLESGSEEGEMTPLASLATKKR